MRWVSNAKRNQPKESGSIFHCEQYPGLSIHKHIGLGDALFLDCAELILYNVSLNTENFEEAIKTAQYVVHKRVRELMNKYGDFSIDDTETEIV